jgi:hypothetical protein
MGLLDSPKSKRWLTIAVLLAASFLGACNDAHPLYGPNSPRDGAGRPTDPVLTVRFNPETKERSLERAALGLGAVLGQGSEDRLEDDQRAR